MSEVHYIYSISKKVLINVDRSSPIEVNAIFHNGCILFSAAKYVALKVLNTGKSGSWERKFTQSIRLLIDYSIANDGVFSNPNEMFSAFSHRLHQGTINTDGTDLSGLRWKPKHPLTANVIIGHITKFSDWLYDITDGNSQVLNPLRKANAGEKILNLAALNHRNNNAFLKHAITHQQKSKNINFVRDIKLSAIASDDENLMKPFDESKFTPLLFEGFRIKGVGHDKKFYQKFRIDYILITMLMHLGGLRISEVFHIYVEDVIPNEGLRHVRVYHPQNGLAPSHYRKLKNKPNMKRKEYLQERYGLLDRRSSKNKKYHAGWKNNAVKKVGGYFDVFMFGYPDLIDFFYSLFFIYLSIREKSMHSYDHPFLFVGTDGEPLSMASYEKAHNRAVSKIGINPRLDYGGTPHCHRHSYGQRLTDAGLSPFAIKVAMHHTNINSQKPYTEPEHKKVKNIMDLKMLELDRPSDLSLPNID